MVRATNKKIIERRKFLIGSGPKGVSPPSQGGIEATSFRGIDLLRFGTGSLPPWRRRHRGQQLYQRLLDVMIQALIVPQGIGYVNLDFLVHFHLFKVA
jgi:hypothetical protein